MDGAALPKPLPAPARVGRWWFQRRSASPLPWFLLMIFLAPEFSPDATMLAVALVGIFASEVLRLWSVAYAGSATRTRGDTIPRLVVAGPYRHVRNPLYIANIAMYTLCGVLFGFVSLSVGIFLYSCVQYVFIVAFEEEMLTRTFGESYAEFRRRVPRWFPSPAPQMASTGQRFDLAAAFRSERSTLILMGVVMLLLAAKRTFYS
jgi:protein-S-isoprenylcysteine O-methyltransferase Ste14